MQPGFRGGSPRLRQPVSSGGHAPLFVTGPHGPCLVARVAPLKTGHLGPKVHLRGTWLAVLITDSVPVHLLWAYLPRLDGDHLEGGNSVSSPHGAFLMLAGTDIRHITAPL